MSVHYFSAHRSHSQHNVFLTGSQEGFPACKRHLPHPQSFSSATDEDN